MDNNAQDNWGVATQQKHHRLFSRNVQNHIAENCCHWRYLHIQLVLCSWTTLTLNGVERFPVKKNKITPKRSFPSRTVSTDASFRMMVWTTGTMIRDKMLNIVSGEVSNMVFRVARHKWFGDAVFQILSEKATTKKRGGGIIENANMRFFSFSGHRWIFRASEFMSRFFQYHNGQSSPKQKTVLFK